MHNKCIAVVNHEDGGFELCYTKDIAQKMVEMWIREEICAPENISVIEGRLLKIEKREKIEYKIED